jgi:hypothetical protein
MSIVRRSERISAGCSLSAENAAVRPLLWFLTYIARNRRSWIKYSVISGDRPMAITTTAGSVDEIVEYYHRFLARNGYKGHLKRFSKRLRADPHSARAEAVVFQILWSEDLHPDIFEDNSTGGPDFRCKPTANEFLVEVVSLDSAAVSKRSGLPLRIEGPGGSAYGLITENLFSVVQSKATQLGDYGLSGVLAITCAYDFAALLMDRMAAQYALGSRTLIQVPIGGKGQTSLTWNPRDGIFWSPSKVIDASGYPDLLPRYQSVSAVLLIAIHPNESDAVGLLHPAPTYSFDPKWLPKVPYVRFKQWPVVKAQIEPEWTLEGHATFPHRHIV